MFNDPKNNNKTNYNNFANKKHQEVKKEVLQPITEPNKPVTETPTVTAGLAQVVKKDVVGKTTVDLRVREEANKDSKELTILSKGTEVTITDVNASEDFYKVVTAAGLEGYCMKKFIEVKE